MRRCLPITGTCQLLFAWVLLQGQAAGGGATGRVGTSVGLPGLPVYNSSERTAIGHLNRALLSSSSIGSLFEITAQDGPRSHCSPGR